MKLQSSTTALNQSFLSYLNLSLRACGVQTPPWFIFNEKGKKKVYKIPSQ
jgi:hypothetical protein